MYKTTNYKVVDLTAPGSKSVSHRLLICAALAKGTSRMHNLLSSEDIDCTAECLRRLGAITSGEKVNSVMQVTGLSGRIYNPKPQPIDIDVRESGTTCRLLAGVISAGHGNFLLRGRGRMHSRPLLDLARALEEQGTVFDWLEMHGCPPVRIDSRGIRGGDITVNMDKSSQFLSGLLLAAPMAHAPVRIHIAGEKAVSWPYVGLTLQAMHEFGVGVEIFEDKQKIAGSGHAPGLKNIIPGRTSFNILPGNYLAGDIFAEGDYSSASYLLAAGAIGSSAVRVSGLKPDSLQGDRVMVDILKSMGARISLKEGCYTSCPADLHGIEVDMGHCPDLVPTVAATACAARGMTRVTNVGHLRLKESDRLAALEQELGSAGFEVQAGENELLINGQSAQAKKIALKTHADHRIAMSLSLLELIGFEIALDNLACVEKSYPEFWNDFAKIKEANRI